MWILVTTGTAIQAAWWARFLTYESGGPGRAHADSVSAVLIGLVVLALLMGGMIYLAASRAALAAVAAMALIVVSGLLAQFADLYLRCRPSDWTIPLHHPDALLIAVGTFTTAGSAGVAATSEYARELLILQMVADTVVVSTLLVGVVALVVTRFERIRTTRATAAGISFDASE